MLTGCIDVEQEVSLDSVSSENAYETKSKLDRAQNDRAPGSDSSDTTTSAVTIQSFVPFPSSSSALIQSSDTTISAVTIQSSVPFPSCIDHASIQGTTLSNSRSVTPITVHSSSVDDVAHHQPQGPILSKVNDINFSWDSICTWF